MAQVVLRAEGNVESTNEDTCRKAFHAEEGKDWPRSKEACGLDLSKWKTMGREVAGYQIMVL